MSDWNFNDNYRELICLVPSAFQGKKRKSEEEVALLIASMLYLRKHNQLKVPSATEPVGDGFLIVSSAGSYYGQVEDFCLYCDKAFLDGITDEDFKGLLLETLCSFRDANEPAFVVEFADALNKQSFKEGELLAILDRCIMELDYLKRETIAQPDELSQIVSCLVEDNVQRAFDPFAGFMDFATSMPDKQFVGYETNVTTRNIALFRLAIAGIEKQTVLYNKNAELWTDEVFDAIITFPPFGYRLDMRDRILGVKTDAEEVVLSRFDKTTNEHGQLIMVVPLSTLSRESLKRIREEATENNWIDTVITLPSGIFQTTKVETAIIVLKKGRNKEDRIRFVNGSDCVLKSGRNIIDCAKIIDLIEHVDNNDSYSFDVSRKEIQEHDYMWLVGWYHYLRLSQRNYDGNCPVVAFDDLFEYVGTHRFDDAEGRMVTAEVLKNSSTIRCEYQPDEFVKTDNLMNARKITRPVVITSYGAEFFPIYCNASKENPIFIKNPAIGAYSIKRDDVHAGYLCAELFRRFAELSIFVSGFTNRKVFEEVRLSIPSIAEQESIFDGMRRTAQEGKIKELDLQSTIDDLIAESKKQFRARKHSLMQNSVSLATNWEDLKDYLVSNEGRFDENDTIGVLNPVRIGEIMKAISENIKIMENKIYHLTDEDVDWGEVEGIVLQDFIIDYIAKHQTARYRFEFEPKKEVKMEGYDQNGPVCYLEDPDWKVLIPRKALQQVFDNIVSNARDHGFENGDYSNNVIKIDYFYEFNCIVLEISNNGKALAEGVDTEFITTYGSSTKLNDNNRDGKSVHEGQGGSEIDGILKQYNAKVEILSNPEAIFTVTYRIVFKNIEDTIVSFDLGW